MVILKIIITSFSVECYLIAGISKSCKYPSLAHRWDFQPGISQVRGRVGPRARSPTHILARVFTLGIVRGSYLEDSSDQPLILQVFEGDRSSGFHSK